MRAGNGAAAAPCASALPTLAALAAAYMPSQVFGTALAAVAPKIACGVDPATAYPALFLFLVALLAAALLCFTGIEDLQSQGRAVPEDGRLA